MPKFGEVVRIVPPKMPIQTPRAKYGSVIKDIKRIVDENPGIDCFGIGREMWPEFSIKDSTQRASSTLNDIAKRKHIKKKMLDGKFRYYPKNYKFAEDYESSEPKLTPGIRPAFSMSIEKAEQSQTGQSQVGYIEKMAKDFYWDTKGSNSLRDFIKYIKNES